LLYESNLRCDTDITQQASVDGDTVHFQENESSVRHGKPHTAGWSSSKSLERILQNESTDVEESGATNAGVASTTVTSVATTNENEEEEEYYPERLSRSPNGEWRAALQGQMGGLSNLSQYVGARRAS
jgi:hypothetical protein